MLEGDARAIAVWAICLASGIFCIWRGRIAHLRVRKGRRQPLLALVSDAELAGLNPEWDLPKAWPKPDRTMAPERAEAYAQLARRTVTLREVCGNAMTLIGGAWLSLTLVQISRDYLERARTFSMTGQNQGPDFFFGMQPEHLLPLLPLVVTWAGLAVLASAKNFASAADLYEDWRDHLSASRAANRHRRRSHGGVRTSSREPLSGMVRHVERVRAERRPQSRGVTQTNVAAPLLKKLSACVALAVIGGVVLGGSAIRGSRVSRRWCMALSRKSRDGRRQQSSLG